MIKKIIFKLLIFINFSLQAEQFLYPVAHFADDNLVMIYQKSLDNIELWFFDQKKHIATKMLSSFFIPANFQLLPSENGFSFIDRGNIKIQYFTKRSPKTIGIYEPISFFSSIHWIDDHHFYCTAIEGDFYQIFYGDDDGNMQRLSCEFIDFLYPQKINNEIYCIKRDLDYNFKIVVQPWLPINFNEYQILPETIILSTTSQPLCFLHMISKSEGFYLQAPEYKGEKHNELYEFSCYHLFKNDDEWQSEQLFSFMIPLGYIHGSSRLYESIEPFLPNYTVQDYVYYTTYNKNTDEFEITSCHIKTKTIQKHIQEFYQKNKSNNQLFAPYILQSKIYCGKIIQDSELRNFLQQNLMDEIISFDVK